MKTIMLSALFAVCVFTVSTVAAAYKAVVVGTMVKRDGNTLVLKDAKGVETSYRLTAKTNKVGGDPELGSIVELYISADNKVDMLEWMKQPKP